jgi:outer membrane protein assembly factor BamB
MKTTKTSIIGSIFLLLLPAMSAFAHTYIQLGVGSNFLVDEDKVFFVQSDDTLTVLQLDTGEVIARKSNIKLRGGTLLLTDEGILVLSPGISLLDKSTLEWKWSFEDECSPTFLDDRVVSYDGYGLVSCRDLASGEIIWSYDLPGALDIVVENGKVLLFHSAVYDGPKGKPAVVLLDLKTGQQLLYKTTPPGIHYLEAYFDGQYIYLPSGSYEGEYTPNITRFDKGRPSALFERLLIWDLNGEEVKSIMAPTKLVRDSVKPLRSADMRIKGFFHNDKYFFQGKVWDSIDTKPPGRTGRGQEVSNALLEDSKNWVKVTQFEISDGTVMITMSQDFKSMFDKDSEQQFSVELKSKKANWRGTLPYLKRPADVVIVGGTDDYLLLGSNFGHVECIDKKSGKSLWIYVFPTMRLTTSYSSSFLNRSGLPPYWSDAAAIYKSDNQNREPKSGMILDDSAEPSTPKIIFDPAPIADPYRKLPLYRAIAWSGAIIPTTILCLVLWILKKKQWDFRITAGIGLVLTISVIICFLSYGRVSIGSSIGLQLGMIVPLTVALMYSLRSFRKKRRIISTLLLFCSVCLAIYIFLILLGLGFELRSIII